MALHVLIVGVFYLQWPGGNEAPAEPEAVNVELVEPPKEEPPPKPEEKKQEEKKAEEPPPPPPPPPQSRPVQPPSVAVRPSPTQLDERDEPAAQEAGGVEQPKAKAEAETPPPAAAPVETPSEKPPTPDANAMPATSDQGELPASKPDVPDAASLANAVPLPKPEPPKVEPVKPPPEGAVGPNLKPAKKIIATGQRPRPTVRQIMGNLSPRDRVGQLCVAEAMAQITDSRGAYEGLEPHTGKKFPISGNIMDAQGAFNVGSKWFPINYRCEVDIDNYIVTDFRFNIGPQLGADDVKRLKLVVR